MKKVLLSVLLLALGVTGGVLWYQRRAQSERAAAAGVLRIHGTVEVRDAQLAFRDQERVASLLVDEGAVVAAGDLLATLRSDRLDSALDAMRARLAAAQAALAELENGSRPQQIVQAEAEVAASEALIRNRQRVIERLAKTAARGASSAQALDDARAALEVEQAELRVRAAALDLLVEGPRPERIAQAEAEVAAIAAELRRLEQQLADTELRAPAAGVIQSRILEVGETASPERPVFTLALTDRKEVRAFVPEPSLGRVATGTRVTVISDSFGGRRYDGTIGFVSPIAEFTPKAVATEELRTKLVFEVRVLVSDPDDELRLGMPVSVDVAALEPDR